MIANFQYNNDAATLQMDESYQGGGGGGASTGGSSGNVITNPTARTIQFTITSYPPGASILIDGVSSGFTTPHTLSFTDIELLTSKTISLLNGSSKSVETYILHSQAIQSQLGASSGGSGGGGSSYGGGYSGGGSNPYVFNPGDPNSNNANYQ